MDDKRSLRFLSLLFIFVFMGICDSAQGQNKDNEDVLKAKLESLNPPWYDKEKDSWQRINLPKEKKVEKRDNRSSSGGTIDLGPFLMMFFYLIAGLVIGILGYLIFKFWQERSLVSLKKEKETSAGVQNAHLLKHLPFELNEKISDPRAALNEALAKNDWMSVCVWTYAIALLHLDEIGQLRLSPGVTNREYLRQLNSRSIKKGLRHLMVLCERVYFGRYVPIETEARESLARLKAIESIEEVENKSGKKLVGFGLLFSLLALWGCQSSLQTDYGVIQETFSINGLNVFYNSCKERLNMGSMSGLGKHLDKTDSLIYVNRYTGLPSEDQTDWLISWLNQKKGRKCVLVLRGDTITPWLCHLWAQDARRNSNFARNEMESKKQTLIAEGLERYRDKAIEEDKRITDEKHYNDDFELGVEPSTPILDRVSAGEKEFALLKQAPVMLQSNQSFVFEEKKDSSEYWETLYSVGGRPIVVECSYGDSQLAVVLNGTSLLNGAMPDENARHFANSLIDYLGVDDDRSVVWLKSLSRWDGQDHHPNMFTILFLRPPFNFVLFHILFLGLILVGWRSLWVGRRHRNDAVNVKKFSEHVDASGLWLQRTNAYQYAHRQISTFFGVKVDKSPTDIGDAIVKMKKHFNDKNKGKRSKSDE